MGQFWSEFQSGGGAETPALPDPHVQEVKWCWGPGEVSYEEWHECHWKLSPVPSGPNKDLYPLKSSVPSEHRTRCFLGLFLLKTSLNSLFLVLGTAAANEELGCEQEALPSADLSSLDCCFSGGCRHIPDLIVITASGRRMLSLLIHCWRRKLKLEEK
ncbi:hypothetical protein MUG91_G137n25 [Manis pentadactyla]|nr:hypothetical protein MUG91_G137n25 [Manis pentadactyla]